MRPRLTHIWAEAGTENGSLLKEKGMTRCTERPAEVTYLEGSRKGTYFLEQAAQNLTVQSRVCAKNFLVNIVYKFCK